MATGNAGGVESDSIMPSIRSSGSSGRGRRLLEYWFLGVASLVFSLIVTFNPSQRLLGASVHSALPSDLERNRGYAGSSACANCHRKIYEDYMRTDMGRSLSRATPSSFERIPRSAKVFDPHSRRYFEVFEKNGDFFQSEYETGADGRDLFRETHKMEWIIGAGAIGFGAIVERADFLFEAPLSFYSQPGSWELSPGYEFKDYGFTRAILPNCIGCHSGRPRPIPNGQGRFYDPPFSELSIGCENCHGPGGLHVFERVEDSQIREGGDSSIVNPARLSPWLADNICMSCHQTGDARVLKADKTFQDFRPGTPLDETIAIFMIPFKRESPPQADLLQHYFSMTLSQCYRATQGRLSCISCHDPHLQPRERVSDYYRQRCLACHTEKSCAVPVSLRQRKDPPDDCAGCHMPKRNVKVISHAALTNHRITRDSEEPYPETAFHLTTPQLPDLIYLNRVPGQQSRELSLVTLLDAYGQLAISHPEYRERYVEVARRMAAGEANNFKVWKALAGAALAKNNGEGAREAIQYLRRAIEQGAASPEDYEQLATLLASTGQPEEAAQILERGIKQMPYDPQLYRLLAEDYRKLNKPREACAAIAQLVDIYPQDPSARTLLTECARKASH